LPFVIAQPSFIIGERDQKRTGEAIGVVFTDAAASVIGAFGAKKTRDRYASIRGEELARGLVRAALDPAAEGKVFTSAELRG
jgi:hypothetical protein